MTRARADAFDLRAALIQEVGAAMAALQVEDRARAIHRCRVHLKKARALARLARLNLINAQAREIMHTLSPARDLAALEDAAERAAKKEPAKMRAILHHIAEGLRGKREQEEDLALEPILAALKALQARAMALPLFDSTDIDRDVRRVARRARKAYQKASDHGGAEARHTWRKREKDRLYGALLLGPAWRARAPARRAIAQSLGEALGAERDLVLLIERLEQEAELAGGKNAARVARAALRKKAKRLAKRANALGALLHRNGA